VRTRTDSTAVPFTRLRKTFVALILSAQRACFCVFLRTRGNGSDEIKGSRGTEGTWYATQYAR
jgi:hypothetical protein